MCPKPDMNSFTYMRSEADCIWQILCEQTTLRDRRFIGSQAAHGVILIFQDLEASTQSASIRTGVYEMMSRFDMSVSMRKRHHYLVDTLHLRPWHPTRAVLAETFASLRATNSLRHLRTACATVRGRRCHAMHVGVMGGTGHISASIVRVLHGPGPCGHVCQSRPAGRSRPWGPPRAG